MTTTGLAPTDLPTLPAEQQLSHVRECLLDDGGDGRGGRERHTLALVAMFPGVTVDELFPISGHIGPGATRQSVETLLAQRSIVELASGGYATARLISLINVPSQRGDA